MSNVRAAGPLFVCVSMTGFVYSEQRERPHES